MFTGTLRDFQVPAYRKMVERQSLLVAMDMGLGKTVITIAAIERLLDGEWARGGLIICGASLKYQWKDEIEKFTDGAKVIVIDGTPDERKRQYAMAWRYEYVILTYDAVVDDWKHVKKLERDYVVLDEAVAIKSFTAKRSKKVKQLDSDFRFALTGQPVENRPEEVFSIMEWVDEEVLGHFTRFDRAFIKRDGYGRVKRYQNLPLLHETLQEAMVRKTRHDPDVAAEMPDVEEESIYCRLDSAGRSLYETIRADLEMELASSIGSNNWDVMAHYGYSDDGGSDFEQRGRIMSRLTCLRMLCDHPDLLRRSAALYDGTYEGRGIKGGSMYASELKERGLLEPKMGAPKLRTTVEQVDDILQADPANKIVIFSFFKTMLRYLQDELEPLTNTRIYDGDMNARQRDAAKKDFQRDPNVRILLSSDAGGVGVDLPQANYLCNYDLPWSAGKMDQRNARIIRLSSEWSWVTLLNFMVKGSIEERQYKMLEQKRAIASAVVDGTGINVKGQLELSLSTLSEFLEDTLV